MRLPDFKRSSGNMLDGIKSRFGFSDKDEDVDGFYDDDFANDFGDYGDYSEYSEYGPDYQEEAFDDYDARYDYTPRSDYRSSNDSNASVPKLVSIDDVRTHTQVPESLGRDPLPPRHVTSASRTADTQDSAHTPTDYRDYDDYYAREADAPHERSESLDSLFTPIPDVSKSGNTAAARTQQASAQTNAGYDPYEAYEGAGSTSHTPTRSLTVLRPVSYSEVERVAKALKAGDAVVLALRTTPEDLVKRVLDFSFGVSSALDASVDCIADKVFAITCGTPLTDAEKMNLRTSGVL